MHVCVNASKCVRNDFGHICANTAGVSGLTFHPLNRTPSNALKRVASTQSNSSEQGTGSAALQRVPSSGSGGIQRAPSLGRVPSSSNQPLLDLNTVAVVGMFWCM